MDPDQTARSSLIWDHTVCLYAKIGLKSLQEYSADDINIRHFQMQVFLAFEGLIKYADGIDCICHSCRYDAFLNQKLPILISLQRLTVDL